MYQVLGLPRVLAAYGAVVAAVAFAILILKSGVMSVTQLMAAIGSAGSVVGVVFALLGETSIFPRLCRLPILRSYLPDIDGVWVGGLGSNRSLIVARESNPDISNVEADSVAPLPVKIETKITVRLFAIHIASETKSATSRSVAVQLVRGATPGRFDLFHIFEARPHRPAADEQQSYLGASLMTLGIDERGEQQLVGHYWTDRDWTSGKMTAGTVVLKREPAAREGASRRAG